MRKSWKYKHELALWRQFPRMRYPGTLAPVALVTMLAGCAVSAASDVYSVDGEYLGGGLTRVLDALPVSASQLHVQQTPIANREGAVYIANIEPGDEGDTDDINLHTVLRKGVRGDDKQWSWTSSVVDTRTLFDAWHTAPAIGLDRSGRIHIAYNMHNLPWQYKRSRQPGDIDSLEFHGQNVSMEDLRQFRYFGKTSYPGAGTAGIPGNQITYPAFYNDRDGELYITYRFAARPALRFKQRTMSGGIARFDMQQDQWTAIGARFDGIDTGGVDVDEVIADGAEAGIAKDDSDRLGRTPAFAGKSGWTVYHPRLTFGPGNQMNVNWFWRRGIAGTKLSRPCFLRSTDRLNFKTMEGERVDLPVPPEACGNMRVADETEHYSVGNSTVSSDGTPYILLSPDGRSREIHHFSDGAWTHEKSPRNATEIFFDHKDRLWAIASGLRISRREKDSEQWVSVYEPRGETDDCIPRVSLNAGKTIAWLYSLGCERSEVSVYRLELNG